MQFQAQATVQTSFPARLIQNILTNADEAAGESAAEARCCGWFDSSYELSAGLEVIEENKDLCFAD